MQRLIAIVIAVFFLGLAGLMASVTLFVTDPHPVVTSRAPLTVHTGETPEDGLRASLAVDPAFRFEITGEGARGSDKPSVWLRGADAGADDIEVTMEDAGEGFFQGRGSFPAAGRWTLEMTDAGETSAFVFILQE